MTRRVLCALLAAGSATLFVAFAQSDINSGQWMVDFRDDGQIQFTLHREHNENSFPVSAESFQGLSRNASHFEFVRDAGSFICDGRFAGAHGAGTFVFEPNPKYIADMKSMGYNIEPDRRIEMASLDISRTFVHDLENQGYRGLSLDDLIRLRIHGVSIAYIRGLQDAGYRSLAAEDLVHLRIHGVTIEFIRALESYGYRQVPADDLVKMRIHGVSAEFIRDLKAEGYSDIPVEELVRMQIHGVTPEMVRKVRAAGFSHPTTDQLVQMRIHGLLD